MPLFTRKGLPDDCTFSFDANPDPAIFSEVQDAPAPAPAPAPEPVDTKE